MKTQWHVSFEISTIKYEFTVKALTWHKAILKAKKEFLKEHSEEVLTTIDYVLVTRIDTE